MALATGEFPDGNKLGDEDRKDAIKFTAIQICGYIPGLNVIVGIVLVVLGVKDLLDDRYNDEVGKADLSRGILTILTGPLLILADIAGTIAIKVLQAKGAV